MKVICKCTYALVAAAILIHPPASGAQAPQSVWVYPSTTGNLLYRMDERGQRIADFSQCGYKGGTEPLPNVSALIPTSRWVYVSIRHCSPAASKGDTSIESAWGHFHRVATVSRFSIYEYPY